MCAVINNLFRIVIRKFSPVKYIGFALLFLLLGDWALKAQPCTIIPNTQKICIGSTITFNRSPLTATDSAYVWSFGDNSSSNQSTPTYQYTQAGTYMVNLRVYKIGGSFCDAQPLQIQVFPKPIANYTITPNDTQCFNQNRFVFNDLSGPGTSNAPIKRRTMIYGDGAFDNNIAPFSNQLSHFYTDVNGNNYTVVLEVEDTNGCVAQLIDTVVVHPRIVADMTFFEELRCGQTVVKFRNLSLVDYTGLQTTWLFGNGQTLTNDTANEEFYYTYYGDTTYYPQLIIKDKNGCSDTSDIVGEVHTFVPDSVIQITPVDKSCFRDNVYNFDNKTKLEFGSSFAWTFYKAEDFYQVDSLKRRIEGARFPSCGIYNIKLRFNYYDCSFESDTQVTVYGPRAIMSDTDNYLEQSVQCGSYDTVRLAYIDKSCYFLNPRLTYLWDWGDAYAPACTTNTRAGINVNMNCRYSVDSTSVKHRYSNPNQSCYLVSLIITDTVMHCADTAYKNLRLAYPKADWDSSVVPPQPRARAEIVKCTEAPIKVNFNGLEPSCGPEEVWFMPDTSCLNKVWKLIFALPGFKVQPQDIYPADICSTDSIAVFGVIARNGLDPFGNACYDTGYYTYRPFRPFQPAILRSVVEDGDFCLPHRVKLYISEFIRKDLLSVTYTFGDGTPDTTVVFLTANDTIMYPIYHNYYRNGSFTAQINYFTKDSCPGSSLRFFSLGNEANLRVITPQICSYNFASFFARIRYSSDTATRYWSDTARFNAGREQIYWNYGDDTVWYQGKEESSHKYAKPGVYFIKVAYKDSSVNACFDTIQGFQFRVLVSGTRAVADLSSDTFYCAPTVVTYDDVSYGMHGDTIARPSLIVNRFWQFDAGKGTSTLKQPAVFYNQNGKYTAKLYSESVYGCYDTTSVTVNIVGPTPNFVIVEDTFGCIPFTVKLRNQTGQQLRNWIWYFNDQSGAIYSTKSDTDITFTYTQPGTYKIDLLGEDSITNPTTNETKNCTARFPYLENPNAYHPRKVTALPIDTLKLLVPDTVCIDVPFIAKATGTNHNIQANWLWGINNVPTQWPVNTDYSYIYDSSGMYKIEVDPILVQKFHCVVGAEKEVTVLSPLADFTFKLNNYPNIPFTNLSQGAVRYLWDFGQPSSGRNTSTDVNPTHNYGETSESYKVCLMAFDARDCMDSICKIIPIRSSVKIPNVFTPDNADGRNDAFDIDIEGWEKYELYIYNRWGTMVFEGFTDGLYNDGINWDGKDKNDGSECPEGTYFVIFKYKLITEPEEQTYHGTVTLIRD
jgi:gliding motility-associated-like protein